MIALSEYIRASEQAIPLSFLLGFYVVIVIGRWWSQYLTIPWPDSVAVYVSVFIAGLV